MSYDSDAPLVSVAGSVVGLTLGTLRADSADDTEYRT